jgi:hypothetical protein
MASATKNKRRTAAQLAADGFAALVEKVGMAEAVRYVQLYHHGAGSYTRERRDWLDAVSHDRLVTLMTGTTQKKSRRKPTRRPMQKANR